jgi:ribonuclease T2
LPDGAVKPAARIFLAAFLAVICARTVLAEGRPGDFDFYVLTMTWSPGFCAVDGDADGAEQCRDGPNGFLAHGLWPQYERGYPESCASAGRLPRALVDSMLDIIAGRGLVRHEWARHGTCSGLSAEDYFDALRAAYSGIAIPDAIESGTDGSMSAEAIERAFIAVNPGLERTGIALVCRERLLVEVRLCLTRDLAFRDCDEVDGRGCRASTLFLYPPQ